MWGSMYFQNAVSSVMEQMIFFHDHTMVVLVAVMGLVGYFLFISSNELLYNLMVSESQGLELVWTFVPILLLGVVGFPSLCLLYMMEEGGGVGFTVKTVAHQWYWVYEYTDFGLKSFDSYMEEKGWLRLGLVSGALLVPLGLIIRVIVTSADVIHSWTVPSVGVKVDAVPGRLNQLFMEFSRPGMFMGQCSEICGANHSFMPIVIGVTTEEKVLGKLA